MAKRPACEDRVDRYLENRISDLRKLWEAYNRDPEREVEDIGCLEEYGLWFDYMEANEDEEQEGFFRYQLSTGGPGDEFRFFVGYDHKPYRVEYWFLDWFDGAKRILTGDNLSLLLDIFGWFNECGSVDDAYRKATED